MDIQIKKNRSPKEAFVDNVFQLSIDWKKSTDIKTKWGGEPFLYIMSANKASIVGDADVEEVEIKSEIDIDYIDTPHGIVTNEKIVMPKEFVGFTFYNPYGNDALIMNIICEVVKENLNKVMTTEANVVVDNNDVLINGAKVSGGKYLYSPKKGYLEYYFITLYKDADFFKSLLPIEYYNRLKGGGITGLWNEGWNVSEDDFIELFLEKFHEVYN